MSRTILHDLDYSFKYNIENIELCEELLTRRAVWLMDLSSEANAKIGLNTNDMCLAIPLII